jgi:AraC-like DNA-binding protein
MPTRRDLALDAQVATCPARLSRVGRVDAVHGADQQPVRLEVSGGDTPIFAPIYTTDVDEARAYLRSVSYESTLLPRAEVERFAFGWDLVQLGPFTLGEISYGAGVDLTSPDLVSSYHVLMAVSGGMQSRHRGHEVLVGDRLAGVYGPAGDVGMDIPVGFRMLAVRIERTALEQEIAAAAGDPAGPDVSVRDSLDVTHGRGRSCAELVRLLYTELHEPDSLIHDPLAAHQWWQLTLGAVALAMDEPGGEERHRFKVGVHPRSIKRVLDAMHADPGAPFTVTGLARIAGVSAQALQEAFHRHVGMLPMMYLRGLRLDQAHAELSQGDPHQVSVKQVALRWGFTHLGQFQGAYHSCYGQTPAQTLHARP